jgi:hypothetical protein
MRKSDTCESPIVPAQTAAADADRPALDNHAVLGLRPSGSWHRPGYEPSAASGPTLRLPVRCREELGRPAEISSTTVRSEPLHITRIVDDKDAHFPTTEAPENLSAM